MNLTTKVARRVIESDAHAQNTLPSAISNADYSDHAAAATAVTRPAPETVADSCEMIEIPAGRIQDRSKPQRHHCQVRSASLSV